MRPGIIQIHFKTVQWQYGYRPSTDSDMRSVYGKIYLSVCLFVCLSVSLSVYHKDTMPLVSELYKIRHCLGLKHNFFRQRRPQVKTIQIGQHNENMWWWLWTTLVTQVVSALSNVPRAMSSNNKIWLHVCLLATILLSSLFKTWLVSLVTIMLSVGRALFVKAFTCN